MHTVFCFVLPLGYVTAPTREDIVVVISLFKANHEQKYDSARQCGTVRYSMIGKHEKVWFDIIFKVWYGTEGR